MNDSSIGLQVVALLVCVLPVSAVAQQQRPEISAERLSGNVYRLLIESGGRQLGVAMTAFAAEEGVFLVDDHFAHPFLSGLIESKLNELSHGGPIRYILNTHYHPDHNGGNAHFREKATILAHENTRDRLATGTEAVGLTEPGKPVSFAPTPPEDLPDETFASEWTTAISEDTIDVWLYPSSHTDGDAVAWFRKAGVIAVGDIVWPGQFPSIDTMNGGSIQGVRRAVSHMIRTLPDDIRVVTGHGPVVGMDDLVAYRDMLDATVSFVESRLDEGLSVDEIIRKGLPDMWSGWAHPLVPEATWIGVIAENHGKVTP